MFAQRPASTTWELLTVAGPPPLNLWAWFKPVHAPNSVAIQTPPQLWQVPGGCRCNLRQLADAADIDWLMGWTIAGQFYPVNEQTTAYLDLPLPAPVPGVEPIVILWANVPAESAAPVIPFAMAPTGVVVPAAGAVAAADGQTAIMLDQIESYWHNVLLLDAEIRRARMQLEQCMSRVNSLNRDLNTDEALAADNADKKDWQDARRWLRDSAASLSRSIKEIDVGILSGAGQRHRFEDIIKQHVEPRIPFPGLPQAVLDFEMLHKSAKNVLTAAQTALNKGSADGERRANAVLQRIAVKARSKRNKSRS